MRCRATALHTGGVGAGANAVSGCLRPKNEDAEYRRFGNEILFVTTHGRNGNLERFQWDTAQNIVAALGRFRPGSGVNTTGFSWS